MSAARTSGPGASAAPALRVLSMPDYSRHNPYQRLLAGALAAEGVTTIPARPGRRQPFPILVAWLRAGRPGVLHLHWLHEYLKGRGAGPSRLSRLRLTGQLRLLRALGVRIVLTVHNLGGHDGTRHPDELAAHRAVAALADALICHCAAARAAAIDTWSLPPAVAARTAVIPHGSYAGVYPEPADRAAARAALGIPAAARVLAFVGTIRGYKGTEELIEAFRALPGDDLRLLVAGQPRGDELAASLHAAAAGDPRIVLRLGRIPDEELGTLVAVADAVVLPFRDILTSGSAILALSLGRPVVAPALGCLPETVPPAAGIRYDPDAPDALAGALRAALDADLAAMGVAARATADALAWGPIAAATAAAYRG